MRLLGVHPVQDAAAGTRSPYPSRPRARRRHPGSGLAALRDYRNYKLRHLDDTAQVQGYADQGVTVIKGHAAFTGPRSITVDGRELSADNILIATGSQPIIPPIDGLDDVPVWTNREATTLTDIPARALIIGGSAVGVELATFLARFGTQVSIVQSADRLLEREDSRVGELVAAQLSDAGVRIHTSRRTAAKPAAKATTPSSPSMTATSSESPSSSSEPTAAPHRRPTPAGNRHHRR